MLIGCRNVCANTFLVPPQKEELLPASSTCGRYCCGTGPPGGRGGPGSRGGEGGMSKFKLIEIGFGKRPFRYKVECVSMW